MSQHLRIKCVSHILIKVLSEPEGLASENHIANPSKLTEKCFLDSRNLFSNQENNRIISRNKKNKRTEKNFLVLSARKFDLN